MSDKSYVTMERHACKVCGQAFDTGALLLDKHMRPVFERYTVTGWGMCPKHQKLLDDGYIALVEVSNARDAGKESLSPEDAARTGRIAHIRRTVLPKLFKVRIPEDMPMLFADKDLMDMIVEKSKPAVH